MLVDANLLVYAIRKEAREHGRARAWLDDRLNGVERVGLPWPSLLAFLRLVTSPRVMGRPLGLPEAWRRVTSWLELPPTWVPLPTPSHADVLAALLVHERGSRVVPDAHLAALAIEHGLRLCSTDGDFARFRGLDWDNPLAG
ncbi:MAG: PIN domain-containing protein [Actinomycetota bacterium]|nr:PIN domain-containing protein [Actinomycetota bacterium]